MQKSPRLTLGIKDNVETQNAKAGVENSSQVVCNSWWILTTCNLKRDATSS